VVGIERISTAFSFSQESSRRVLLKGKTDPKELIPTAYEQSCFSELIKWKAEVFQNKVDFQRLYGAGCIRRSMILPYTSI